MKQADAFPLTGLEYLKGGPVDLAAVRGSKVVVVECWATCTCGWHAGSRARGYLPAAHCGGVHVSCVLRTKFLVSHLLLPGCPPCRQSIPHLTELAHKYSQDAIFLGLTNEARGAAAPFVAKMGASMDYVVACDSAGVSARYMQHYGLNGIPSAIIVNKEGKMVWGGHPMDPQFEAALKKACAEGGAPAVNLRNETEASLTARSVKELKQMAADNRIDLSGCIEKSEMVAKLLKH